MCLLLFYGAVVGRFARLYRTDHRRESVPSSSPVGDESCPQISEERDPHSEGTRSPGQ